MPRRAALRAHETGGEPAPERPAPELLVVAPGSTLAESLRRRLEAEISAGRYPPGTRLDEQEVAGRYGVSRTPVREAFRLLAAGELVELRGRQGAVVRSIRATALVEMFQVMAELEGLCARLAARRITEVQRARLIATHEGLVAVAPTRDVDAFYEANLEFHEVVYEAARNAFLAERTRALRNQVGSYRRRVTHLPNRIADTIREHEAIRDAILEHRDEEAGRLMRDHVNLLGDRLLDFLAAFE